jgi:hypothetical protein
VNETAFGPAATLYDETFTLNVDSIIDLEIELATSRGFEINLVLFPPNDGDDEYHFMDDSRALVPDDRPIMEDTIDYYDMGNVQGGGFGFNNLGTYFFNESSPQLELGGSNTTSWVPPGRYRSEDWSDASGNGTWRLLVEKDSNTDETVTVGEGSIRYCGVCGSTEPVPSPSTTTTTSTTAADTTTTSTAADTTTTSTATTTLEASTTTTSTSQISTTTTTASAPDPA